VQIADNDFQSFLPLGTKDTKLAKRQIHERAIFKLFSLGVVTNRDEWVYDVDDLKLRTKVRHFVRIYNDEVARVGNAPINADNLTKEIKWTRAVKRDAGRGVRYEFNARNIRTCLFRPFVTRRIYFDRNLNEMQYQLPSIFTSVDKNSAIILSSGKRGAFSCLVTAEIPSLDVFLPNACQVFSVKRLSNSDHMVDNITDWALAQFRDYEGTAQRSPLAGGSGVARRGLRPVTKDAIFHYVYAVLHDPIYREKYVLNLKREFPRIPFYSDFWKWADWGEKLMALHIGYETVEPWPLDRIEARDEKSRKAGLAPKAMLRANKETGNIQLDSETQLTGVPPQAWTYRLGNRSALEWILDQYKEKMPKDPTIREKFNTYRFADHKEKVIDLLRRVTRVSVETMKIVEAMRDEKR
jgi:predicted helicase